MNTVHYRIDRIEALTGRNLSRLEHKVDLHAALLCHWLYDDTSALQGS
ncbi:helix-turn-helix domain-containing protein [Streptomyces sp. NPDC006530]